MTSTHNFQGMDGDVKPSSRVLAPPGGGSSNIFHTEPAAPAPARQAPTKPSPAENQSNILGQPQQTSQERSIRAAPKQGESTFSTLFGPSSQTADKAASPCYKNNRLANSGSTKFEPSTPTSDQSSSSRRGQDTFRNEDTFRNVFGGSNANDELKHPKSCPRNDSSFSRVFSASRSDRNVKTEPNTPQSHRNGDSFDRVFSGRNGRPDLNTPRSRQNDDSFARVFGGEEPNLKPSTPKSRNGDQMARVFSREPVSSNKPMTNMSFESLSLSERSHEKNFESSSATSNQDALDSSYNRVFGDFPWDCKQVGVKLLAQPSAFNPITGEPYGSPAAKTADSPPSADRSGNNNQNAAVESSPADTTSQQQQPASQPPQPAAAAKEHTSTRVLNPPGGKSTPLW